MMDRRAFLAGTAAVLAVPLAAAVQQAGQLYRIGVLDVLGAASNEANLGAFRQGLQELGYVEGQNYVIEYRSADGRAERFPDLATELVRLKVDVIVTRGTSATLGARHVRTQFHVMAASGDPVFSESCQPGAGSMSPGPIHGSTRWRPAAQIPNRCCRL